jgi:hypothetical protein
VADGASGTGTGAGGVVAGGTGDLDLRDAAAAVVAGVSAAAASTSDVAGVLWALGGVGPARVELGRLDLTLMETAREAGASWQAIADAIGLASRQAGDGVACPCRDRAARSPAGPGTGFRSVRGAFRRRDAHAVVNLWRPGRLVGVIASGSLACRAWPRVRRPRRGQ